MRHEDDYEADEPFVVIERHSGSASSFLWGLAIGATVALLFAPRSGLETRHDLERRAKRVKARAQDAAEDLTDSVVDRYQHARQVVEDRLELARQAIEMKKEQASHAIRAGREAAQQARSELERRISETKAAYQTGVGVTPVRVTPSERAVPATPGAESSDDDLDRSRGA